MVADLGKAWLERCYYGSKAVRTSLVQPSRGKSEVTISRPRPAAPRPPADASRPATAHPKATERCGSRKHHRSRWLRNRTGGQGLVVIDARNTGDCRAGYTAATGCDGSALPIDRVIEIDIAGVSRSVRLGARLDDGLASNVDVKRSAENKVDVKRI